MAVVWLWRLGLFLAGLTIGSFLNVVVYRLPRRLSVVWGRSFCPHCQKKIAWFNNIPLLSFVLLKGRCRRCHSPISWRYPLIEFLGGILFVLGAEAVGPILTTEQAIPLLLTWILFAALIVIFFIDLERQIIPDEVLLPVIGLYSFYNLLTANYWPFAAALGASLFLLLIWVLTKGRGMGLGDIKFAFLMGLVLGPARILVAFYLAFLTGAVVGLILILVKKVRFGQKVAFGPFLASATVVAILWGEKIFAFAQKLLF